MDKKEQTPKCTVDDKQRFYLTKDRQGNYQVLNELAYEKKLIYE